MVVEYRNIFKKQYRWDLSGQLYSYFSFPENVKSYDQLSEPFSNLKQ